MYKVTSSIKLPDTDAAGILFYGSYFKLAHEGYESFLESVNFSLNYIISQSDFFLLIAHAEADYKQSLRLGDKYSIEIKVEKIGQSSFILTYEFKNSDNSIVAKIKTVHVAVDKKTNKKITLPNKLREKIAQYT